MQDATFWMDVFSLIPLIIQPLPPYVCLMWNDLAKGLEALKLLRLWRLIAIPASHLEAEYSIGVHIGRVVMWVFLLGHVLGCYWFYILESNATTDAHILTASDVGQPSSLFTWYLFALRDGFYILTGRVRPAFSPGEMALVSLTSPTGSFFFAIVSANCTVLLSRLDAVKRKHHEQMCFIRSAMKTLNLPEDLRNRIEKYHLFLAIHHNLNAYSSLFQGLSVQLFTELKATIYDKLFRNAPFFRNAPEEFIHAIVLALEETTFSPGENVIVQGEIGAEMYWILRGRCDVIDSSGVRVVATLCENNFFGEVALLVQTPRLCSVRAATYSLLAQITREKFLPIIDEFPEQKKYFVERIRSYQLDQNTVHKTYSSGSASSDPPVLADAAAAGGAATGELDESGRSNSKEKLQETLVSGDPMKSAGEKPSGSKKKAGLLLSDDSPPETAFRSAFRKTGFARVAAITDDDDEDGNAAGPGREQNNGKTGGPPSLFFPGAGAAATAAPGGVASFFGGMGMGFSSSSGSAANISGGTAGGGTSTATGTSANTTSNAFGVGTLGAITGGMSKPRSSFAHPNREKKLDRRTSFAQGIPAPGEDSLPLGPEVGPEDSISRKGSIVQRNSNQIGQLSRRLTRHSFGEYGATEMPRTYTEIDHELESEVARLHREMEKQTATNFRLAGNPIHEKMHQLKVQQEDSAQRRPSGVPALQKAISKVVLGNRLRQSFAAPASHHAADKESNVGGEKMEAQSVVGVGAQSNRPAGAAGGMSAAERMRRASAVSNHNFISLNSMLNPGSGPPVGRATTHNFGGAASAVSHHVNIGGAAASTNISSGTEQRLLRSLLDPIKEELHIIREMIEDIGVQQDTLEIQIRQLQVPPTSVYGNAPAVPSPSLSNNAGIHHAGSSSPSQSAGMTTNGAPNNPSTAIGSDPAASTAVLQHLGHQHKVSTSTASSSTITASMSMTSSNIMQGGGMGGGGLEGGGASSFTPSAMKGSRAAAGSKSPKSPSAPGSPVSGTASASSHGAGGGGESSFSDSAFPAPANANNAQPGGATTTATGNIPGETSSGSAAQGFGATLANMLGQAGAREPPSSGRASRDEESAVGTNSFDPPSMSTSAVSGIYSNGPPPDIAVTRKATEDREPPGLTLDGRVKGGTSTVGVDAPD
ncbi:unnamed protein product [Amoebophrya sp. A25]|nr:unnamed protein product [Amoebophrya sp. A25]|eukprot:GSA25T00013469001.1